jgi:hypothetical protein
MERGLKEAFKGQDTSCGGLVYQSPERILRRIGLTIADPAHPDSFVFKCCHTYTSQGLAEAQRRSILADDDTIVLIGRNLDEKNDLVFHSIVLRDGHVFIDSDKDGRGRKFSDFYADYKVLASMPYSDFRQKYVEQVISPNSPSPKAA